MNLNPDFRDLLTVFESFGVRYVVVGAYALAAHGVPRFTADLDLFVEPTPENAERILGSLQEFGFGGLGLAKDDLCREDVVIRFAEPPRQIDLLTSISGVDFAAAWSERFLVPVSENLAIPFLSRNLLIKNKAASRRTKDLADLELLRKKENP